MESASSITSSVTPSGNLKYQSNSIPTIVEKVVLVTCPTCRAQARKVFSPETMQKRASNPASIVRMLFTKEHCPHAFIAYIDSNMNIKGYEAIDIA